MSMIECPECKKEVSSEASACPHCGIKRPGEKQTVFTAKITANKSDDELRAYVVKYLSSEIKDLNPTTLVAKFAKINITRFSNGTSEILVVLDKTGDSPAAKLKHFAISLVLIGILYFTVGIIGSLVVASISLVLTIAREAESGADPKEVRSQLLALVEASSAELGISLQKSPPTDA